MIIDGHAHACGDFLTPEGIIQKLDETGADRVVLVPGELGSSKNYSLPYLSELFKSKNVVKVTNVLTRIMIGLTGKTSEIEEGNEYVYKLSSETEGRVVQFVWITSKMVNPVQYLDEKFEKWKFKGVKLHQCWDYFSINSACFKNVAEWTEKKGLPLFIHMYSDKDVRQIIEYKKSHPGLKLIVAHLFGLELFIISGIKDKNLYFDTSTLQLTSTERVMKAIKHFGAERIIFGSDTPYGKDNLSKNIERVRNLKIPEEDKKKILGENIAELTR